MNRTRTIALVFLTVLALALLLFVLNLDRLTPESQPEEVVEETVDPKAAKIDELMGSLSQDQKIGQLFLARVPEGDAQLADIKTYGLGGYVIFGRDVEGETTDTLKAKIDGYQQASPVAMIIASDEEGGEVSRVSQILDDPFSSAAEIYAESGMEGLVEDAKAKSELLKGLGINVNLAPVCDVAVNPDSFIYDRTLGLPIETPLIEAANLTSQYVEGVVTAMKEVGIGCCLKHFPGYGENGDSHTGIVYDQKDAETFREIDFLPFQAGIRAGAGSVMITHNIVEAFDPNEPASLSPQVHQILRDELGFTGAILSDDFDMEGLTDYSDPVTAAVTTINAGTDMVLSSNYAEQIAAVKEALADGTISGERLDDAVRHVLSWKYDLGLLG